ncbi:hypothetical protein ACQY0O_003283 [Thecaphora frezii]
MTYKDWGPSYCCAPLAALPPLQQSCSLPSPILHCFMSATTTPTVPIATPAPTNGMTLPIQKQSVRHSTSDGFPLALTLFEPRKPSDVVAAVVIGNATGVQARFYHALAAWLAERGVATYTFDYRYSGASFPLHYDAQRLAEDPEYMEKALFECPETYNLTDTWGRLDLASIVERAYTSYPDVDLTIIGHSLGGHLMMMLPPTHYHGPVARVKRMMNVCGGNAYYRNRPKPDALEYGLIELLVKPLLQERLMRASHVGVGFDLPYGPGREWLTWVFHRHFAFERKDNMKLARSVLGVEVLGLGFADDDNVDKLQMDRFMGMLNHSDGLKRSLFIDPSKRSPPWPACGHVNAFARDKKDAAIVEHGVAYTPKPLQSKVEAPPPLRRQDTVWPLFLAYIKGQPLPIDRHDHYKVWRPEDETDVEAEQSLEYLERRGRPDRFKLAFLAIQKAKL